MVLMTLSGLLATCSPTDHSVVLKQLRAQLAQQFHECVPLGWTVVPHNGLALPGVSVEINEYGNGRVLLPALWLARVDVRKMARRDVRATVQLLDALARAGMLERQRGPHGSFYRLVPRAMPYYFADANRGNDPDALPYLCYSTIVPDHVLWTQPVHVERTATSDEHVFRAAFAWRAGPIAPWASDPFIRSHGVMLTPTRSPAVAKFVQHGSDWSIAKLYSAEPPLPLVIDTSVWPGAPAHTRAHAPHAAR